MGNDAILQMAVKAINDPAGLDGHVPTILVFGAYPRMVQSDLPSASITKRAQAIKVAMAEAKKFQAKRQVDDALAIRSGPKTTHLKELALNSEILVFREKKGWTGPHKLISIDNEECTVAITGG